MSLIKYWRNKRTDLHDLRADCRTIKLTCENRDLWLINTFYKPNTALCKIKKFDKFKIYIFKCTWLILKFINGHRNNVLFPVLDYPNHPLLPGRALNLSNEVSEQILTWFIKIHQSRQWFINETPVFVLLRKSDDLTWVDKRGTFVGVNKGSERNYYDIEIWFKYNRYTVRQ